MHYNSAVKPWQHRYDLEFGELFYRHLDQTAWAGWRPKRQWFGVVREACAKLLKAVRKRRHEYTLKRSIAQRHADGRRELGKPLALMDHSQVPAKSTSELRAFVVYNGDHPNLMACVTQLMDSGVDRVLLAANRETLSGRSLGDAAESLHQFALDDLSADVDTALWRLLYNHGEGHWCLVAEGGTELRYPESPRIRLKDLCGYLDANGFDGLMCHIPSVGAASKGTEAGEPIRSQRRLTIQSVGREPLTGAVAASRASVIVEAGNNGRRFRNVSQIPLLRYRRDLAIAARQ